MGTNPRASMRARRGRPPAHSCTARWQELGPAPRLAAQPPPVRLCPDPSHPHLHTQHLLRDVHHGMREPALQALGKVPDRLGQGTCGWQRGLIRTVARGDGAGGGAAVLHSLGMGRSTSGMRISTRPWYSTLSQCLVHCSTGSNLERSTRLALGSRFSASSCL